MRAVDGKKALTGRPALALLLPPSYYREFSRFSADAFRIGSAMIGHESPFSCHKKLVPVFANEHNLCPTL